MTSHDASTYASPLPGEHQVGSNGLSDDRPPLVELDSIAKSYGAVRALKGVHFDLKPGEVHALLGQNGAGKSTLIKVLAGVTPKDGGSIRVDGQEVDFRTPAGAREAGIAVVYQELSLIPEMSVADNMFLMREPGRFGIADKGRIVREATEFLERQGFPLDARATVADLPYAYRQLTEIATALMGKVRILVLDEPTSSLSGGEETTLFDAIAEVTKRGVGVIYVTHRLGEVFRISQRVTIFRDGTNVATRRTMDTDIASLVADIVGTANKSTVGAIAGLGPRGEQPASAGELALDDSATELARRGLFRVAIALHTDSEWSRGQVAGVVESLRRVGAEAVRVTDADFDAKRQIRQLDEVLDSSIDAVIGIPVDEVETADAFRAVSKTGRPLVLMDNAPRGMVSGQDYSCVVSADNYGLGLIGARLLSQHVPRNAKVASIGWNRAFYATDQRRAAFGRWMEDERPDVTVVQRDFDHPTDAARVAATILEQHPDLCGVFVVWDEPALEVVALLRERSLTLPVTTVDLSDEAAVELARGGLLKGIAAQRPFDQGEAEATATLLALLGRRVPPWIAIPGVAVTPENVLEAYEAVWHRPAPTLVRDTHRPVAEAETPRSDRGPDDSSRPAPMLELREVENDRLSGVNLEVQPGQIVGLAGMVGSGRTEVLETIFGLRPISAGELLIRGARVTIGGPRDAIRRGMALVPEDRHKQGLVLDHSIERNIAMPRLPQLQRAGMFRRTAAQARAIEAMSALSVKAPGPATPVRALSGGNQQKVVFGKWREPTPTILLLDEPTVGVDIGARDQIYDVVREAARGEAAVLIVSSELGELVALCDRVAIVVDGRIGAVVNRSQIPNEEKLHQLVQEAQR